MPRTAPVPSVVPGVLRSPGSLGRLLALSALSSATLCGCRPEPYIPDETTVFDSPVDSTVDSVPVEEEEECVEDPALTTSFWKGVCSAPLRERTTSTSTILDGDKLRMYYMDEFKGAEFQSATSTDGCTWNFDDSEPVGISTEDIRLSNPTVAKLDDDKYVMLFEKSGQEPRLYRATSTDGVNFVEEPGPLAEGSVLTAEGDSEGSFISVPDMLVIDGVLWIYFVSGQYTTSRAYSLDEGATWSEHEEIAIVGNGFSVADTFTDPDVVVTSCGGLRLFFAYAGPGGNYGQGGIRSAISPDGSALFTSDVREAYVIGNAGTYTIDPDVVQLPSKTGYYMYWADSGNVGLYAATHP